MSKSTMAVLCSALPICVACVAGAAGAQTPRANPMPDGSDDMYAGLGLQAAPRYPGAREGRVRAAPLLQAQWSHGVFVSGLAAGMHWSAQPLLEYGPLLALHPGRDGGGERAGVIGVERVVGDGSFLKTPQALLVAGAAATGGNRLDGLDAIPRRLQGGAFLNLYLAEQLRLTSRVLYGAGRDRHGATLELGLQALAFAPAPHHSITFDTGLALANRSYQQAFFGIDAAQAGASGNPVYRAHGGWRDAHAGARWHWTLAPAWLFIASADATRQLGSARTSPLTTRANGVAVTGALAVRF